MKPITTTVALMMVLAACGSPATSGDGDETTSTVSPSDTTTVGSDVNSDESAKTTDSGIDRGLQLPIEGALADLAERLQIPESEVEVLAAYLVVWPDASLGCPLPDMSYAQVLTDGAVIELGVGDIVYNYHMGGSQHTPFLCEQPSDPASTKKGTQSTRPGPIELIPPKPTEESIPPPGYDY